MHRELELLGEFGGATPIEAIQMATSGAARILGFEDLLGRVEADMLADFVVLAANPLEEIPNVRRVELVVHQGCRHRPWGDVRPRPRGDPVLALAGGSLGPRERPFRCALAEAPYVASCLDSGGITVFS